MFCRECGAQVLDNAKFCQSCGTPIIPKPVTSPPPVTPTPTPIITTPPPVETPEQTPYEVPSSSIPPMPEPTYTVHDVLDNDDPMDGSPTMAPVNRSWNTTDGKPLKKKRSGCMTALLVLGCIVGLVVFGFIALFVLRIYWAFSDETKEEESLTPVVYSDSDTTIVSNLSSMDLRDYYTTVKGDGSDTVTLMVYLLGSDLESDGGYASTDLEEMLDADFGDDLNLLVMTGGSTQWSNRSISDSTCQYWQVKDGDLISIDNNVGKLDMTAESTLSGFISEMTSLYPANRYGLILWDHGGGTFCGFGYDEYYPDGTLSLENISHALASTDVKFDFVGFDACLMGTLETAVMLEPYADYMIASEELEEATGWYYTEFLEAWGDDTSMSTLDMATILIDSFVEASVADYRRATSTLSVVDLREIPPTYQAISAYFDNIDISTDQDAYTSLSYALSQGKSFGDGDYEQFDIVDFVAIMGLDGAEDVIGAVNSAVKYYANSDSIDVAYGLSMYFPYDYPEYYSETAAIMEAIGYDDAYTDLLSQYVSASAGEYYQYTDQYTNSGGGGGGGGGGWSPSNQSGPSWGQDSGSAHHDFSNESWFDAGTASSYADWYTNSTYEDLEIILSGDEYILPLSNAQWETISLIELQVLLDDGSGYIDLGSDNVYELDRDDNLIVAFDYTWVTLDGHTVPFYAEEEYYRSDRDWYTYGIVPALLNDLNYVEVVVYWDDDEPYGYVTGYRKYTATGEPVGKGTFAFKEGDTLEWLFDYYSYDGEYEGCYQWGEPYVYTGRDIEVSYDYVGNYDAIAYFQITDIYNHVYTSESVYYTD